MASRAPSPPFREPLTVLTNYAETGIGDFGRTLVEALRASQVEVTVEETSAGGMGASQQRRRIGRGTGPLLVNLGLTAWGRSGWANFLGFAAIGRRSRRDRRTVAIVHHAIEGLSGSESGYPVGPIVRWGAHRALGRIRAAHAVVFSPRLEEILRTRYDWRVSLTTPLPVRERVVTMSSRSAPPRVVTAGYLAPYKGIDLFLDAAALAQKPSDWAIVGSAHRVLSSDPAFRRRIEGWDERARVLGVRRLGYLADAQLDELLSPGAVGLLPYTSSSGSSASFSLFAERGSPVVATDLPEFRYLRDQGAGIRLVAPRADAIAEAVRGLLADPRALAELSTRQREFAHAHSWSGFIRRLLGLFSTPAAPGPESTGPAG